MRRKKKQSREHRKKISDSLKARWAGGEPSPSAGLEAKKRRTHRPLLHGHPAPRDGRRF